MTSITPQDLQRKLAAGEPVQLLDVRTPREYSETHVPGAVLEPLDALDAARLARQLSPRAPLYVICRSGGRARQAIAKLEKAGLPECVLVEGGTVGWVQAGLPVESRPATGISLERQVRITAGALVFAGTLLGFFVHPGFLLLPGFVGGGLVFAGITDTCGLGMMLARMPWNRGGIENKGGSCGCSSQKG